ncbi:hypothetical protein AKUH3B101J_02220 [Apilactobacillus kunkeei]|uniref:hypothetical protein n=1 Tax=Apilactobacillus kunkeei TaxID=148814 RepID=UPI0006B24556|nr:hypothetical protein [Apilactobacillus kunkeei]MCK8620155.1 hypothetical protein [Apilactobacillus kunkeei]MCK8634977.1 hypothetical protein [Apilactobacillus kunkeei]TPR54222.1 hypothetical protein DY036_03450 [Apilactobacillus kunkeei]CAI2562720.1 hypothetical protein AKUH3B104J_02220 [Apilactobacillus kunkeei]CAI2562988.1 hypothetical protein AKUH3B101J_02220 [Apilactobacillus kunkeei]
MEKQWDKSKITVNTLGSDNVLRKRNIANAIQEVSPEQMAQLIAIVAELTGGKVDGARLVQESKYVG